MSPRGLSVSPDEPGAERPPICLGHKGGATATLEMVQALQDVMSVVYEVPCKDISVDAPFNGGYITRRHGSLNSPMIQLEFSRGFYMPSQVGVPEPSLPADELQMWNDRFEETLRGLAASRLFR